MAAAIAAVAVQIVLVGWAVAHARRRRAEKADTDALGAAEAALATLSQRLMHASEQERATIARAITDDVAQQLAALTLRLHALGVATEGRAGQLRLQIEDLCAQFWTLEREILAISDTLYHRCGNTRSRGRADPVYRSVGADSRRSAAATARMARR